MAASAVANISIFSIVPKTEGIGMHGFGNIANMNQIPLEFEFLIDGTYETKGTTTVQV